MHPLGSIGGIPDLRAGNPVLTEGGICTTGFKCAEPYRFTVADGKGAESTFTIRTCPTLAEPYCFTEAGGIGTELTCSEFKGTVTGGGMRPTLAEPYSLTEEGGAVLSWRIPITIKRIMRWLDDPEAKQRRDP